MAKGRLNKALLRKMAAKLKRSPQAVMEGISHRARRRNMTPHAAQVCWARELNIGTTSAFQALESHEQLQVREHGQMPPAAARRASRDAASARPRKPEDGIRHAVNLLLADTELQDRCADTLKGRKKFDRAVNQATLILEDRLRTLSGVKERLVGVALASKVLHPRNVHLRVSDENEIQEGIYFICAGLASVFRNPTHHHLTDNTYRQDALSVCGFIDTILRMLAQGKRVQPAAPAPAPRPAVPAAGAA